MNFSEMRGLDPHEILPIIEKASLFSGLIFQQGTLEIQSCSIHKVEIVGSKVVIQIKGKHNLSGLHPLCINFAYRNLTFRLQPYQFESQEGKIVCHIPLEAKALGERSGGERHILPFDSCITAKVHRSEKRDTCSDYTLKIVDVSKRGLGAYLVGFPEGTLTKFDHLWVQEINGQKLAEPIFTRIEYVNQRKFRDNETVFRIGLSIDKELPEEVFLDLISKCHLVLSA